MRAFLILLISSSLLIYFTVKSDDLGDDASDFRKYLSDFNIVLKTSDSFIQRRNNFIKTRDFINSHNEKADRGESSFRMALNDWAHLNDDEFSFCDCDKGQTDSISRNISFESEPNIMIQSNPSSLDWSSGMETIWPIQDQLQCGSCYAFAAIGVIEAQMFRKFGDAKKLSEQEALECAANYESKGCGGGHVTDVYDYSKDRDGCTLSAFRRYLARNTNSCLETYIREPYTQVKQYAHASGEAEMIALLQTGPITASMRVYGSFNDYSSGIYEKPNDNNDPFRGNHAVIIVGYGTAGWISKKNYWKIRNSWGTAKGEKGYYRIARGQNECGIERGSITQPINTSSSFKSNLLLMILSFMLISLFYQY